MYPGISDTQTMKILSAQDHMYISEYVGSTLVSTSKGTYIRTYQKTGSCYQRYVGMHILANNTI